MSVEPMVSSVVIPVRDGKVLVSPMDNGCWHCPGGRREADETSEQTAIRELLEETGMRVAQERLRHVDFRLHANGSFVSSFVLDVGPDEEASDPEGRWAWAWMSIAEAKQLPLLSGAQIALEILFP